MRSFFLLFSGLVTASFLLTAPACKKDTDCKAVVKCIDSVGNAMASAEVLLYAQVKSPDGKTTYTADVKANGTTAADGKVSFTFKLPAIYDIRATKTVGTRTLVGTGLIKLEEGKTVEKTVTVR